MTDNLTAIYQQPERSDSPEIERRRSKQPRIDIKQAKKKNKSNKFFLSFIWACFSSKGNKDRKIRDKYESVLYLHPEEEDLKQQEITRKPIFNGQASRSSGIGNNSSQGK